MQPRGKPAEYCPVTKRQTPFRTYSEALERIRPDSRTLSRLHSYATYRSRFQTSAGRAMKSIRPVLCWLPRPSGRNGSKLYSKTTTPRSSGDIANLLTKLRVIASSLTSAPRECTHEGINPTMCGNSLSDNIRKLPNQPLPSSAVMIPNPQCVTCARVPRDPVLLHLHLQELPHEAKNVSALA